MATLQEWLADPTGARLLREVVGTDQAGRPRGILGDDELRSVVGNFPISALAAFPASGLDQSTVDELLRRLRSGAPA
jgi:beta-glucosidase